MLRVGAIRLGVHSGLVWRGLAWLGFGCWENYVSSSPRRCLNTKGVQLPTQDFVSHERNQNVDPAASKG